MTIEKAPLSGFLDCFRAIVALETDMVGMRALSAGRESDLSPSVRALLSKPWTADSFTDAMTARKSAVMAMAQFMTRFDLLLTPCVPLPAFAIDLAGPGSIEAETVADDAWTPALYPANLTGQPAASVPAGWTDEGLPVGLQIVGRHLADRTIIAAATASEACQPWIGKRPVVCG